MEKDIVLVVDGISPKTKVFSQQYISGDAQIVFSDGDPQIISQYIAKAKVLVTSTRGVPPQMLAQAPNCIYIQKYGAGINNIDIERATARGIPVGNVPATNSRSVAECALMLILAVYKQTVRGHNGLVKEGKWLKTVLRDDSHELTGKTIGIIGFGNIGKHLRRLLSGFQCRVIYYDAFRLSGEEEQQLDVTFMPLDALLREADVVTLHCPLTDETRHMINAQKLALMKSGAVLVNCARGGVVNETALYDALAAHQLLGAGIDTYEKEPIDQSHPFCSLPNVVLSPHNGGGTVEAIEAVVMGAAANINSMLRDNTIAVHKNIVNGFDTQRVMQKI